MRRIGTALMALVMIVAIMVMTIIIPATIGTVAGAIVALLFSVNLIRSMLIGALGGAYIGFALLLNAGLNGGKKKGQLKPAGRKTACLEGYKASVAPFCGLFSLHKKIAQNGRLSPEAASGTAGRT